MKTVGSNEPAIGRHMSSQPRKTIAAFVADIKARVLVENQAVEEKAQASSDDDMPKDPPTPCQFGNISLPSVSECYGSDKYSDAGGCLTLPIRTG